METRGTKRPLDEHAWESDKCTICKARAQFRVLHPECKHGICDECIPRTENAQCEVCRTAWEYTLKALTAPCGGLVVAAFTRDGEVLISNWVQFHAYRKPYIDHSSASYACKQLAAESPRMGEWMRQQGLIRERNVAAKVAKHLGFLGSDSYVEKVGEDMYVIYATTPPEKLVYNVVLITPVVTRRLKACDGKVVYMPRPIPLEDMNIMVEAVLRADALSLAARAI